MNVELAQQALADAKAHPDNFNMSIWWLGDSITKDTPDVTPPCGTVACYAGFVSLRAAPVGSKIENGMVIFPEGGSRHVETYAEKALEITHGQGGSLFYLHDIGEVELALSYLADNPDATEFAIDQAACTPREYV